MTHELDMQEPCAAFEHMDTDPDCMWPASFADGSAGDDNKRQARESKEAGEAPLDLEAGQASILINNQYFADGIPHRGHLGLLVPWFKLIRLIHKCGLDEGGVLWQAIPKQSRRFSRSSGMRARKQTGVPARCSK